MIGRLPKKYRKKYKQKLGLDEELVFFAVKTVGSAALFFITAIGIDVYRLLH